MAKIMVFNSRVSVLDYVSQLGWRLVSSYIIPGILYDVAFVLNAQWLNSIAFQIIIK